MSKMNDLAYDIEQLYVEGHSAKSIAKILGCPVELVLGWIEDIGVADLLQEDEFSPFQTSNS